MSFALAGTWTLIVTASVQCAGALVVLWCIGKWRRLIRDLIRSRDAAIDARDEAQTHEHKMRDRMLRMERALWWIAAPMRTDGTWNRDREACRQLAQSAIDEEFA